MTIFVVEPRKSGKGMTKPQKVHAEYERNAGMLNTLIKTHPECIYYTDDESGYESQPVPADNLKMLLASRLTVASAAVDHHRESDPFTPTEFAVVAQGVAEGIAVIRELERLWENLFNEVPNLSDTIKWAIRANQSSEV